MHALAATHVRRAGAVALTVLLATMGMAIVAPPAHAAPMSFAVDSLLDDGVGNTLRNAINLANANPGVDSIDILIGGAITLSSGPVIITDGVEIYGNGHSPAITRANDQGLLVVDLDAGTPIGDRELALYGIAMQGAAPFTGVGLFIDDTVPLGQLTIDGSSFTDFDGSFEGGALRVDATTGVVDISDSTFNGNNSSAQGGAISISGAAGGVNISDSSLLNNSAANGGALVVQGSGDVAIIRSIITGNTSPNAGGFAYLSGNSSLLVDGSTFTGNVCSNNSGGAIHVSGGVDGVDIIGSTFTSNTADINGGAMNIVGVDGARVSDTVFTSNIANASGGGISFDNAGIIGVTDSSFTTNTAVFGGGVFVGDLTGGAEFDTNVFYGNTAGLNGGGITVMNVQEEVFISDSTFEFNLAADPSGSSGGAIWAEDIEPNHQLIVERSTFTRNRAGNAGVSIGVDTININAGLGVLNSTFFEQDAAPYAINVGNSTPSSTLSVLSSTIVGNGAVHVGNLDGTARISNSIIDGEANGPLWPPIVRDSGSEAFFTEWSIYTTPIGLNTIAGAGNQFSTDPQLGPLTFNGGPTRTMLPAEGSPALNSGDSAYPFSVPTDQRGVARIALARIDIGAVELQALAATGTDINPAVPLGAAALLLIGAVAIAGSRRQRTS